MLALKMAYRRNRRSWLTAAAVVALAAVGLVATLPRVNAGEAPVTQIAQPNAFEGTWVYRSFLATPDAGKLLSPLGVTTFTMTEKDGVITGTRKGQTEGETFPLTGTSDYQPNAVSLRLTGSAPSSGKTWDFTYFGYLVPTWSNADKQSKTIMGTVTRSDPDAPDAMGVVTFFTATQLP